jgi:RHS repeat-associated protein
MQLINNDGTTIKTRYYAGDYEETYTITIDTLTGTIDSTCVEICYIRTPEGLQAAYRKAMTNQSDPQQSGEMYYFSKDHAGSIMGVISADGEVVQRYLYDAWGKRRVIPQNPSYLGSNIYYPSAQIETPIFDRGYIGEEHIDELGLINLNARLYDPILGRFLSPDLYVQMPDNLQNFNRYIYGLNNPLMYVDPGGEKLEWLGWLLVGLGLDAGIILGTAAGSATVIVSTIFVETFSHMPIVAAIGGGIGGSEGAGRLVENSWRIAAGLFVTDKNKSFFGRVWEFASRLTWQAPQTIAGLTYANVVNYAGQIDNVDYYGGATVSSGNNFGEGGAVTLGNYITGGPNLKADPITALFQHEYGHYIQSQGIVGGLYLLLYGIPSLASAGLNDDEHRKLFIEQDANALAFKYFSKNVDGFNWKNEDGVYESHWDFKSHPIFGYDEQTALNMDYKSDPLSVFGRSFFQIMIRSLILIFK